MEASEAQPYTRTLRPDPISEADCPVCNHPLRAAIEAAVYNLTPDGGDNDNIARRFGLGDGGPTSGEIIRRHRSSGHMLPREHYQGRSIVIDDDGRASVVVPGEL